MSLTVILSFVVSFFFSSSLICYVSLLISPLLNSQFSNSVFPRDHISQRPVSLMVILAMIVQGGGYSVLLSRFLTFLGVGCFLRLTHGQVEAVSSESRRANKQRGCLLCRTPFCLSLRRLFVFVADGELPPVVYSCLMIREYEMA